MAQLEHEDVDLNEYQGEIDDICKKKCQDAHAILKRAVIVEDVCLGFKAFGGLPGKAVYSPFNLFCGTSLR